MQRGLQRIVAAAAAILAGCGGSDSGGDGLGCGDEVPQCLTDAIAALRACVATPDLALGTPVNNSGVVENLGCTGADLTVAFSTFSYNPFGTVPIPSSTTLTVAGTTCAEIELGTGTSTSDGTTRSFELVAIERPGAERVQINRYDGGELGVQCGGSPSSELEASASALAAGPEAYVAPDVVRDDAITMMSVQLVDPAGGATALLTCTR
ncbi:MAG: hypothetical protein AB7L28_26415 [Kofleriaceae bacterium]